MARTAKSKSKSRARKNEARAARKLEAMGHEPYVGGCLHPKDDGNEPGRNDYEGARSETVLQPEQFDVDPKSGAIGERPEGSRQEPTEQPARPRRLKSSFPVASKLKRGDDQGVWLGDLVEASPEDAVRLLLSDGARENLDRCPEEVRAEISGTLAQLGNTVAMQSPSMMDVSVNPSPNGVLEARVSTNGQHLLHVQAGDVPSALVAALVRIAQKSALHQSGSGVAMEIDKWVSALTEAGKLLAEVKVMAHGMAKAMTSEQAPVPVLDEDEDEASE